MAAFRNGSFQIGGYGFRPIKELGSKIADTNLIFLGTNAIVFDRETLDPWYQATRPVWEEKTGAGMPATIMYATDDPAPPLACLTQCQTCNPNLPKEKSCSKPMGVFGQMEEARKVLTYHEEHQLIGWLARYLDFLQPREIIFGLGSQSLQSRNRLRAGLQGVLPVDQWENDVEHWFNIASASLQYFPVFTAAGYFPTLTEEAVVRPNSTSELNLCQNQVRIPAYDCIIRQIAEANSYTAENKEHSFRLLQRSLDVACVFSRSASDNLVIIPRVPMPPHPKASRQPPVPAGRVE